MTADALVHTVYALMAEGKPTEELDRLLDPPLPSRSGEGQLARIVAIGGEVV